MPNPASRDRILDATLRIVAREGAEAASLRRIGSEAGLHNSSLFHHFRGKDAIHDALAARVIDSAARHVAPLASDDPPRLETLVDALSGLVEQLAARPDEAAFLIHALSTASGSSWGPARRRATRGLLEPVWEWIVRARDAGEIRRVRPQPTTLQLMGLVLLEPAWGRSAGPSGLRPALRARRRELESWVRGVLARG